ncbi:MAG: hypothetical protein PHU68_06790 [Paludibacter sp.]|nr:hypothetical protein [Paludibacter sp.]
MIPLLLLLCFLIVVSNTHYPVLAKSLLCTKVLTVGDVTNPSMPVTSCMREVLDLSVLEAGIPDCDLSEMMSAGLRTCWLYSG